MDKMIDDLTWNALDWERIELNQLDENLTGKFIKGAELVDAPIVDGLIIYLEGQNGSLSAVMINADDEVMTVDVAEVKE